MAKKPNDDLFQDSAMTFGEHLEELRVALFKSLIWLVLGLGIGLIFADRVIGWAEYPVHNALVRYHQKVKIKDLEEKRGRELTEEEIKEFTEQAEGLELLIEEILVDPDQIREIIGADPTTPEPTTPEPTAQEPTAQEPTATEPEESDDEPSSETEETKKETTQDKAIPKREDLVPMVIYRPVEASLTALRAEEVFIIWLKAGLVFGAIIVSPMVFWHFWQFISAGLYPHEKKYVWVFLPFSLGLFFGGASLAYFFVFDPVLDFLFSFNLMVGIKPDLRISEWVGFVLILPLGFGISFQLPLVMYFLNRMGLIDIRTYLAQWRIAILVIFVLSMILTPADPISMLLLALPLTILYFGGILLCLWMPGGQSPIQAPTTTE